MPSRMKGLRNIDAEHGLAGIAGIAGRWNTEYGIWNMEYGHHASGEQLVPREKKQNGRRVS